jgi:hypothetical protein
MSVYLLRNYRLHRKLDGSGNASGFDRSSADRAGLRHCGPNDLRAFDQRRPRRLHHSGRERSADSASRLYYPGSLAGKFHPAEHRSWLSRSHELRDERRDADRGAVELQRNLRPLLEHLERGRGPERNHRGHEQVHHGALGHERNSARQLGCCRNAQRGRFGDAELELYRVAPILLAPGRYFIGLQMDVATDTVRHVLSANGSNVICGTQAGTFGTIPNITTVSTTFTTAVAPICQLFTV